MLLFDVQRDEEGRPKLSLPAPVAPTLCQLFVRKCYLFGITEPAAVEKLWQEEQERRKAKERAGDH